MPMRRYAVAVLVTMEAFDEDIAIENLADALKGISHDWSFTRVVNLEQAPEVIKVKPNDLKCWFVDGDGYTAVICAPTSEAAQAFADDDAGAPVTRATITEVPALPAPHVVLSEKVAR